jgi:hypothetical protein
LTFLVKNQPPPRPMRPSPAWISDLFKTTSQYQVRHSYSHVIVHVYTCFHDHAYYPIFFFCDRQPEFPTYPSLPSCLYIASSSPYHAHPHDRLLRLVGIPDYHLVHQFILTSAGLVYASYYTAPTTTHTLNGIPPPSFPFPLQHLSWMSSSMHCSLIRSPQKPTCHCT